MEESMDFDNAVRNILEARNAAAARENDAAHEEAPAQPAAARPAPVAAEFEPVAPSVGSVHRYHEHGLDEFDHQMRRHRADLQSIEAQIAKLDEGIDMEQKRLRELRSSLDAKYHARARLMHVREAMVHFVQNLQAQEVD
jgi:hypothetical protein